MKKLFLIIILTAIMLVGSLPVDAAYLFFSQGNLPLKSQKIKVNITNQIAITTLEMVFYNPHDFTIQPNMQFPVHEKASVQKFSLTDSQGQTYEGKIEEAKQAEETFKEAQAEGLMPAMAVQKKPGVFETSIGAIGPKSRATVTIEYSEILPYAKGMISYNLPFNVGGFQTEPLEAVSVMAEVSDQKEIISLTSISHEIYAEKVNTNSWKVVFEKNNFLSNNDFSLKYEVKADKMAANFLSTRPDEGKDGYFVLMLSPQEIIEQKDIVNRDIVFIMDTSGSMSGSKIAQTQNAFEFFVSKLNEQDRFGIIAFSSEVTAWNKELMTVTDVNRQEGKNFIGQLRASGGTNINEALLAALKIFDEGESRTRTIVFLTDGEATNGVTGTDQIVNNYNEANSSKVRTFTLGVGSNVNTALLNKIAMENRGEALYLAEESKSIDQELISFYQSISTPLLVDLALDMGGAEVSEVYPKTLPNIYQGTQLVVTGRYRNGGESKVKLSGIINSVKHEYPIQAAFVASSTENLFVGRYWAKAKADDLMLQMQTYGQKAALKDEVIALSKEFQFATPFTSFIAVSTTPVTQVQQEAKAGSAKYSAGMARVINRSAPVKRTIIRKTEAKSLSLWGASGFLPIAAIAVPNFRKAREQAREKACYANMRVLQGAVEMYNMDNVSMLDLLTENEMSLLVDGKYLKSAVNRPEEGCTYGTCGDLTADGMIACTLHGTVNSDEEIQKANGIAGTGLAKQTLFYDQQTNQYVEAIEVTETQGVMPWTTRIWNNYLADALNVIINVPLFILGLAFSIWLLYTIVALPVRMLNSVFVFVFPGKNELPGENELQDVNELQDEKELPDESEFPDKND